MRNKVTTRGVIHSIKEHCARCGGQAMYQEWAEPDCYGNLKRYGIIFCQNCDNKTKIHSERTAQETKVECEYEWKKRNQSIRNQKKKQNEPKSL